MATLTVSTVTRSGVILSGSAATATTGDAFPNTGKEFLVVKNGGASPINVNMKIQRQVDGGAVADRVQAVAAGETRILGPFAPADYNDSNGNVVAVCSAVTSVTVQAVACPGA